MPVTRPMAERFWEKVDRGTQQECWPWRAAQVKSDARHKNPTAYGVIGAGADRPAGTPKNMPAHRASWMLHHGAIPPEMLVDHMCHNGLCVNPRHLRLVTAKQNSENRRGPAVVKNPSGYRGVRWNPAWGKWHAYYTHDNKSHYVGRFDDVHEAGEAARLARLSVFTHNDGDK